jgi:rhodanese-related sulfurtransferase
MRSRIPLSLGILILAATVIMPSSILAAEFPTISTQELKAKMDAGENLFLFHALSDIEFNQAYIPGSINICYSEVKTTDKLPQDKDTPIVTY